MNQYEINLNQIRKDILKDNMDYTNKGYEPIYTVSYLSKILIIGQAPGIKAQESNMIWNDKSGDNLRSWLGVSKEEFYDTKNFALIPMDFYYPGKAKNGDLPPRKEIAIKWHQKLLDNMPNLELIILVGIYAQKYYLHTKDNLTTTVLNYKKYLPKFFPTVHPSPLNFRWFNNNPWFLSEVVPILNRMVKDILN